MSGLEQHRTADGTVKTAFVSANGVHAYHRLGTVVDGTIDAQQALDLAHLSGWNVRTTPIQTQPVIDENGVHPALDIPDKFAIMRTNPFTEAPEVFGVVGKQYTPIQNEEHAAFLNAIVDESGAHFETAGSLRGGRDVFVTMRIPNHIMVGGIDPITPYLVAQNSHDGDSAFKVTVTNVRPECSNTLAAAFRRSKNVFKIRHTKNATQAVNEARLALDLSFRYIDDFQKEAEELINKTVTEAQFADIVKQFHGKADNEREQRKFDREFAELTRLFASSPTATGIRGNAWGAYQAFTEYVDFYAPIRNTSGDIETDKARRALFGDGMDYKQRALSLLVNA